MHTSSHEPARWKHRFVHFARAYDRVSELVTLASSRDLTVVEQEALVARFAFTWELAWKLLKDYLTANGVTIEPITPRTVIRAAFSADMIDTPDAWFDALEARKSMAHTYDAAAFQEIVRKVISSYHPVFARLFERFSQYENEE